jgi:hypothetical protein
MLTGEGSKKSGFVKSATNKMRMLNIQNIPTTIEATNTDRNLLLDQIRMKVWTAMAFCKKEIIETLSQHQTKVCAQRW